jgi:hypothetical protein
MAKRRTTSRLRHFAKHEVVVALPEAEEGENGDHHDNESNDIDHGIHELLPCK